MHPGVLQLALVGGGGKEDVAGTGIGVRGVQGPVDQGRIAIHRVGIAEGRALLIEGADAPGIGGVDHGRVHREQGRRPVHHRQVVQGGEFQSGLSLQPGNLAIFSEG